MNLGTSVAVKGQSIGLVTASVDDWIIPRIMHYISFALHLKNLPHRHEMHAMSYDLNVMK